LKTVTEVCTRDGVMHTWVYVHNERQRSVEITWFEYEVSVGEGDFGSEADKEDRRRFGAQKRFESLSKTGSSS
jgi:hypothetical protein